MASVEKAALKSTFQESALGKHDNPWACFTAFAQVLLQTET